MGFVSSCMKEDGGKDVEDSVKPFGASSSLLRETLRCNKIR